MRRHGVRLAFVLLFALAWPTVAVAGQEVWYKTYQDAISAFNKGELPTAEQKFLTSIKTGPKDRGPNVPQVSQLRGFIPEYYLVLIYAQQKKFAEAQKYLTDAQTSVNPKNFTRQQDINKLPRDQASYVAALNNARADVLLGLAAAGTGGRGPGGNRGGIEPGLSDPVPPRPTNQAQFNTAMQEAQNALGEKRYADARAAAGRARDLNVDTPRATELLNDITARESRAKFDTAIADAKGAITARNFAAARTAANRAAAEKVDDKQANDLLRQIEILDTSAQLGLALAARPLDASRVESLRKRLADADGANAMLVVADNALKSAAQQASVRNLTGQINAQLKLRAYDKVAPLVESLTAIDPTNPLIDSARKQIASNVGADGQLRIGVASFYRGQYQAAVDVLGGLVSADRPRAGFYVALSRAAQSLVAGDETQRSALRQQASQAFAAVRGKEAAFAVDLPFVSPAIKHVLGLPAQ